MTLNELVVSSEEQLISLADSHRAYIKFDPIYKRWYYDLYRGGTPIYTGVALNPDTLPLDGIADYYLAVIDKKGNVVEEKITVGGIARLDENGMPIKNADGNIELINTKQETITRVEESREPYEPYIELGGRLGLLEVKE